MCNIMNYRKDDILDDEMIKKFLMNRDIQESTCIQYINRIKSYCNFIGKTPAELVEEAGEEQDNGVKFADRKVKKYLQNYINKLQEKRKSENTIKHTRNN